MHILIYIILTKKCDISQKEELSNQEPQKYYFQRCNLKFEDFQEAGRSNDVYCVSTFFFLLCIFIKETFLTENKIVNGRERNLTFCYQIDLNPNA